MYIKHISCKWSANNPPGPGWNDVIHYNDGTATVRRCPWKESFLSCYRLGGTGKTLVRSNIMLFFLCLVHLNQLMLIIEKSTFLSKYICFRTFAGSKSRFLINVIPIGIKMIDTKVYKQTDINFVLIIIVEIMVTHSSV